jgi:hypothetical protein
MRMYNVTFDCANIRILVTVDAIHVEAAVTAALSEIEEYLGAEAIEARWMLHEVEEIDE